ALDGVLVEDRPQRPRIVVRRRRSFVDGERGIAAVVVGAHLLDPLAAAVAPVGGPVLDSRVRRDAAAGELPSAAAPRQTHFVEEALADLIDGDEFLEARRADV